MNKKSKLNRKSKIINHNSSIAILDVGTGSGTIIISLAHYIKTSNLEPQNFNLFATDISPKALTVAKKNAKLNGVAKAITFLEADLFPPSSNLAPRTYDLIVANLPYIPAEEMSSLVMDVIHYEPRVALDGGRKGLAVYEKFLKEIPGHLNKGAKIYCEIGINQGKEFKELVNKYLPTAGVKILGDLAGIDRIAIINTGARPRTFRACFREEKTESGRSRINKLNNASRSA
jgi:release factor glutamine methyltransferase